MPASVPTSDEYGAALAALSARIDAQAGTIATLTGRVAALESGQVPPAPPAPPATGKWLSGAGTADPYAFGTWRGRTCDVWETWNNVDTWPAMLAIPTVHQYFTGEAKAPFNVRFPGKLSFAQPLWAVGETAGTNNAASFTALGKALAAAGFGDAFVRLGWEFNGSWYRWHAAAGQEAAWIAAFRRAAAALKAAAPGLRIVWNPNRSSDIGVDARKCWPGADVVDIVGVDLYNSWPPAHTDAAWTAQYGQTGSGEAPIGPGAWRGFAQSVGKPECYPEWGLDWGGGDQSTMSGDDAAYIRGMRAHFASGNVVYESVFNLSGDRYQIQPTTVHYPTAAAAYRQLWTA